MRKKTDFKGGTKTMLLGGAATGALSGLVGSGGPIGAAAFLTLGLTPVAYIASEAATAVGMHILKTIIYSKLVSINPYALLAGLAMGAVMIGGSYTANKLIKKIDKAKFQKVVAALLCVVGFYMLIFGSR